MHSLPKKIGIRTATTLPPLRKYLDEKRKMGARLLEQENEINHLKEQNKQLMGDTKPPVPREVIWPLLKDEVLKAQINKRKTSEKSKKNKPPFKLNWVVPPIDSNTISGGHSDIFRTISYLEKKGHKCRLYFYDAPQTNSLEQIKSVMGRYSNVKADIFYNADKFLESDAIFATHWHTAYPTFNHHSNSKKYYFVQDFESYFEPPGTFSQLAENTYRLGLHGITLGEWLSKKLTSDYGMKCDYIDFPVDLKQYHLLKSPRKKAVLFYTRPSTPRRGFELGVLGLELFHKKHPDYEIHFFGQSDLSAYKISFPFTNHGVLNNEELNKLYNYCTAGIVISFTNMSLIPPEMLAAGCIPIINDEENTREVAYAKHVSYFSPNPRSLVDTLERTIFQKNIKSESTKAAEDVRQYGWDKANSKIENVIHRDLSG